MLALDIKDSDKGHEPQTTDLDQNHTDQLAPDIISRSHWQSEKPCHTDHGHGRKEMVKVGRL